MDAVAVVMKGSRPQLMVAGFIGESLIHSRVYRGGCNTNGTVIYTSADIKGR